MLCCASASGAAGLVTVGKCHGPAKQPAILPASQQPHTSNRNCALTSLLSVAVTLKGCSVSRTATSGRLLFQGRLHRQCQPVKAETKGVCPARAALGATRSTTLASQHCRMGDILP